MTDDKNTKTVTETKPSPFLSQNVWLKRLGLIILIAGLFPAFYSEHMGLFGIILFVVIGLAIVTYAIKLIKGFFSSLWNS
jgi:uncharacterized membrane protein